MSKIIELARKLKKLSEKGVGGEAVNAQKKLDEICKKYNISLAELEEDREDIYWFAITKEQKRFFRQVVASVVDKNYELYEKVKNGRAVKNKIGVKTTAVCMAEIDVKFSLFWSHYESELEIFYSAFIQKNCLYAKVLDENDEQKVNDELSIEEKQRLLRILEMSQSVKKQDFHKQISEKNK